jgi:hypothetical protein
MKTWGLSHFVLLGLLGWGLPGALVSGSSALLITACAAVPVWVLTRRPVQDTNDGSQRVGQIGAIAVLLLVLLYLVFDALMGRQKFSTNLFLAITAATDVIDSANEAVSQGRGVIDLLGAMMVVLPFALIDTARQAPVALRVAMWSTGILYIFYDVGISRGYLLMAVMSVALGTAMRLRNLVGAGALALAAFVAASAARGDFDEVAFSNPLFDAVVWPYINLALLLEGDCGGADWLAFVMEFTKKFVPAFIVPKEIFSFNIEMTRCIYPWFGDAVDSISIFTWLGEMYYYGPPVLTAMVAGILLALLCRLVDVRLSRMQLNSVRVFSGLMCIVLLRSRVQDVFSYLLFLWIFLLMWQVITGRSRRQDPIAGSVQPIASDDGTSAASTP